MVLGILLVGCGGEPGVEADSVVDPKFAEAQKDMPTASDKLNHYAEQLEMKMSDPEEVGIRIRFCRILAAAGANAESTLPTLEEVAANDDNEEVRKEAQLAIDKIKEAVANK